MFRTFVIPIPTPSARYVKAILYTAVAGMLNLMVIIDAAYRAAYPHTADDNPAVANPAVPS